MIQSSPMNPKLLAILFDSGDTLVDEGTEVRDARGVVQQAQLIPGSAETLQSVKARRYPLALVADGPLSTFTNTLGAYHLLECFDALAISEAVGAEKPDARMFQCALDMLHIPAAQNGRVLMVGNNLERDIKGANALGLVSVWLDWAPRRAKTPADPSEKPRYTIHNPVELLTLIPIIESSFYEHP